jgi:hypothetical protein
VSAIVVDHQTWIERGKGDPMGQRYEYKFVRLGEHGGSAFFGVSDKVRNGVAAFGAAKYYELIFERESAEDATARNGAGRGRVASTARV